MFYSKSTNKLSKSTDKLSLLTELAKMGVRKNAPILHRIKELKVEWVEMKGGEALAVPNVSIVFKD